MIRTALFILLFTFYFLLFTFPAEAVTNPIPYEITVSTTVGEPKLTLYGWTSPSALVQLEGQRVSEQVIANNQGYFLFDRILLPPPGVLGSHLGYPELCLTSIDAQSRASFPTCLPPLPLGPFEISIGPVLLPPTISLERGKFLPGDQVAAQGLTIPNSEVTIFLANDVSKKSLISPVKAYSLPKYQIKADENGNFEFNLPSASGGPTTWRLFASATHFGSPSPKSNTLTFKILSWWEWFWEQIKLILGLIVGLAKPYWWQILIIVEISLLLLLWRQKRSAKT